MKIAGTHHVALVTPNFDQLRHFYVEQLGLPVVGAFQGRRIIFIDAGSTTIELIEREQHSAGQSGGWAHFAFEVEDLQATYAELQQQGIEFHVQPTDVPAPAPAARIAFFRDPDGNELELFQPLGSRYPQP
jgi:catechol 2,3-dioxygenase-like lactoylglutathione lyase family enzyme